MQALDFLTTTAIFEIVLSLFASEEGSTELQKKDEKGYMQNFVTVRCSWYDIQGRITWAAKCLTK